MEQPDSAIQSCFAGTVYTFDDASSSATTKGPPDAHSNCTFDVVEDQSGMRIEVSDVARDGFPDKSGKKYGIDISTQPHEGGSLVSIKTGLDWPSSLDVLEEAAAQKTHNELLQAAKYFAFRKASDDGWNRLLAIYDGAVLSKDESERLDTDKLFSPDLASHFARISRDLDLDLKAYQYDKGIRAVLAVGHTSVDELMLGNLVYRIVEGTSTSIALQQDDQGEKDPVENEND